METPGTPSGQEQPGGPPPSLPPADWTTQPATPPPPAGWPPPPPASAGPAPGWRYGGFWRRLVAFIVDGIIVGFPSGMLLWPVIRPAVTDGDVTVIYGAYGLQTLLLAVYFIALWTLRGQTIGMLLLGLRVVRQSDGGPIDFVTALIRYVMLIVGFAVIGLGVIWVAFDGRKRGWHDMVAKTYVIRPA